MRLGGAVSPPGARLRAASRRACGPPAPCRRASDGLSDRRADYPKSITGSRGAREACLAAPPDGHRVEANLARLVAEALKDRLRGLLVRRREDGVLVDHDLRRVA